MSADKQSPVLEAALAYAKRGWPVFPLMHRKKIPHSPNGFKDATTDERIIRGWWRRWPNAGVAIPTGLDCTFDVIDIDPRNGGDVSLENLLNGSREIPETPTQQTGGGGKHFCFKHVPGFKSKANEIAPGIDTKGEGGYIVVAPTIHESGNSYSWMDDSDTLPLADRPDWLTPGGTLPRLPHGNLGDVPFMQPKADGSPALPGSRNVTLASLVGQWIAEGCNVFVELLNRAHTWNNDNPKQLPLGEVGKTVESVIKTHKRNHPEWVCEYVPDPAPVEIVEDPLARAPVTAGNFPVELLNPPGLVGELCRWINATAIKPQPILALANSLAFWGAVFGRKVRTPTDLRTNLYCFGVAASASGKDHSRKQIKTLAEAASLTHELLGGEEVSSDAAILASVAKHPSILFQIDEIGHFINNANHKNAASFQKNIAPTFMKLFSSSNTIFIGKEYAGMDRTDIYQPNVCLYGTTVPGILYDGLTTSQVTDGFLGRVLVFQSDDRDPPEQEVRPDEPPESLVKYVQEWKARKDLPARSKGNITPINHEPITVEMDDQAIAAIRNFKAYTRAQRAKHQDDALDTLWGRAPEHAAKVALVLACGCEFQVPVITGELAQWAVELVDTLITRLVDTISDSVAGSEVERDLLMVKRAIKARGEVTGTQLVRLTRKLSVRQRQEAITALQQSGELVIVERSVKTGPKTKFYRIR